MNRKQFTKHLAVVMEQRRAELGLKKIDFARLIGISNQAYHALLRGLSGVSGYTLHQTITKAGVDPKKIHKL